MKMSYSEKIVAFIDILGFKELIKQNDFEGMNDIYDEFNKMVRNAGGYIEWHFELAKEISKKTPPYPFSQSEQEIIFFSDCVVWSYPMDKLSQVSFAHAILVLCQSLSVLQYTLFKKKEIAIRGGISIGDLFLKGNKIFGPGLVKAYELEKKAKYPRIAFDEEMIKSRVSESEMKKLDSVLSYDYCGFYYLDIFKAINLINKSLIAASDPIEKTTLHENLNMYLDLIVPIINRGIKNEDCSVRIKYEWLKAKLFEIENLQYKKIKGWGL